MDNVFGFTGCGAKPGTGAKVPNPAKGPTALRRESRCPHCAANQMAFRGRAN